MGLIESLQRRRTQGSLGAAVRTWALMRETWCNFDNECVTLLICFEIYYKLKTPAIMAKLTMFKTLISPLHI